MFRGSVFANWFAAGVGHQVSAPEAELRLGIGLSETADEVCAMEVARGLPGYEVVFHDIRNFWEGRFPEHFSGFSRLSPVFFAPFAALPGSPWLFLVLPGFPWFFSRSFPDSF